MYEMLPITQSYMYIDRNGLSNLDFSILNSELAFEKKCNSIWIEVSVCALFVLA